MKDSVEEFLLAGGAKPVEGAVDHLTLVLEVRAQLVRRLRVVQDVAEDDSVGGGHDKCSRHSAARHQAGFLFTICCRETFKKSQYRLLNFPKNMMFVSQTSSKCEPS